MLQINGGTTYLNRCTLSGNTALEGGGLGNQGINVSATMVVSDCTVSGNIATTLAGGLFNVANGTNTSLQVRRCTITGNTGPGGALSKGGAANDSCVLDSSIVAGNGGQDVSGTVTSQGYNLIGTPTGASGLVASDLRGTAGTPLNPLLGPLANNGGPTFTHLPLAGSPAIDAGNPGFNGVPVVDQRGAGNPRFFNARVDIGAVESRDAFTVTSLGDNGIGSLREAIILANCLPGGKTVTFATNGTITLNAALPTLTENLTLIGPGAGQLTLRRSAVVGTPLFRLLTFGSGVQATVSGLTLSNGNSPDGGAIQNGGMLTVTRCVISGNQAGGSGGGGLANFGTLTVEDSTITNNQSTFGGGGVLQINGGTTYLNRCTLSGNTALQGGGLANQGVNVSATMVVSDCTVSGNIATSIAGGILSIANGTNASLQVKRCTITGNTGPGAALTKGGAADDSCLLDSSIVAANGGQDISGAVTSLGYNLIGTPSGASGLVASDLRGTAGTPLNPLIGSLANNGGPTFTHLPLAGSPAIGAGDPAFSGNPAVDQRGTGFPRVINGRIDIGAVEAPAVVPVASVLVNPSWSAPGHTFRFTFTNLAGASFSVLTTTNLALPLSNWTVLGGVLEISPGQYQFTDATGTNATRRFYRVRSP